MTDTTAPAAPRVFISYSHDSREHSDSESDRAQQLRCDGIAYNQAMRARQQATAEAIKAARLEGDAHYAAARFEPALAAYRKAAALTDRQHDPLAWAEQQTMVAEVLYALARYTAAEPFMRDILTVREQQNGPKDPKTGLALNSLAQLLQATNRLAEAEPLMRRALAITGGQLREGASNRSDKSQQPGPIA